MNNFICFLHATDVYVPGFTCQPNSSTYDRLGSYLVEREEIWHNTEYILKMTTCILHQNRIVTKN